MKHTAAKTASTTERDSDGGGHRRRTRLLELSPRRYRSYRAWQRAARNVHI